MRAILFALAASVAFAGAALATPTIDAGFPKHVFAASPASSSVTAVSTSGASLMVAVLQIDSPTATPTVTAAGGLTWTERVHESAIGDAAHWVSVWTAPSPGALSSVTFTFSYTGSNAGMLDVYSVSGASGSPIGANKTLDSNAGTGTPQVTVTALAAGSLILGGFSSFNSTAAFTALANTTTDQTNVTIDSMTSAHAATVGIGNITVGGTTPSATNICVAALELLGPSASTPSVGQIGKWRRRGVKVPGP